ncbi:uncharacterized protein LOC126982743 [Eriocheir sinensis]|uniref:uncharacterized protein LOC126982743 n=1 Tax=Eriocheir sinensis TaxID=95602 RepID=UPI0021C5C4DC|nr:uncharacterized protein LOC126982743 [Eriocheir sinensis]
MVGMALRASVVSLLFLLVLVLEGGLCSAFMFPDEWREARAAAAAATWSSAAHLRPRLAVGGSALASPEQMIGSGAPASPEQMIGSGALASPERTVVPSQPGLEPAASHLWSAASYYPRWPDHIRRAFRGSLATRLPPSLTRTERQLPRPPLVQAYHQINNPLRHTEEAPESPFQRRRPLSTSLWYWT